MWGGSFGSSRNSGAGAPGRKIPATIFRLLSSSATYVVPFSMTGLLSPVALFPPGTTHDYAIRQAGPSILSRDMGGPEMAPQTPQRSSRPGEAVARLDPQRSSRPGEAVARLDPQRSSRPGEAVARLDPQRSSRPGEAVARLDPQRSSRPGEAVARLDPQRSSRPG